MSTKFENPVYQIKSSSDDQEDNYYSELIFKRKKDAQIRIKMLKEIAKKLKLNFTYKILKLELF